MIVTPRLRLVPATAELVDAELRDAAEMASLVGAALPPDWPPMHVDRDVLAWTRERLFDPAWRGWLMHYIVIDGTLAGTCGYTGPPGDGQVEIGYSVVPSFQRRGIASEAARGLVDEAWRRGAVRVFAQTLPPPDGDASIAVLHRLGFTDAPARETGAVGHVLEAPAR